MDTIFFNGKICTLAGVNATHQAVGVKSGLIQALGSDRELKAFSDRRTHTVDLKGACLFSGFIDSHNHLSWFGYLTGGLDLAPPAVTNIPQILKLIEGQTRTLAPGAWIKGSRYAEYKLAEKRHPTRFDLDPVSPEHPVILFHTSFHACVLNSLALARFGLNAETPDPEGGVIERDPETGEPTGVLHDAAEMEVFKELFVQDLEAMGSAERIALCEQTSLRFAEKGLVMAGDALVTPLTLRMYQEALAAGKLKVRVYTMNLEDDCASLVEAGIRTGFGNGRLRIGPIKIFHDGGISNRTAAVSEPYLTPPGDRGLTLRSKAELAALVEKYHGLGFQIAIHCQGDAGLAEVLEAFQEVLGPVSDNPLRHRIEHAGCLWPELIKRARSMNILMAVQPPFISDLGDGILEAFGPQRASRVMPYKSMLEAGLILGAGSDCPVVGLDPRVGLRDAVTRLTNQGRALAPDEALSMDQALAMYTKGAAYLSFDENVMGSIELNKRADFTVLAADPREVAPDQVPHIPVVMTVVDGEVVYQAD